MNYEVKNMDIQLMKGDITKQKDVQAIVNAANCSLLGGGGVDGAIHRAAGHRLLEECRKFGGCNTGEARLTFAYNLPCEYIIHTVGPKYTDGLHKEPELLRMAYENSLKTALKKGIRSIAFPAISTGVYGYPLEEATRIAVDTVTDFMKKYENSFEFIRFIAFDDQTLEVYQKVMNEYEKKNPVSRETVICFHDPNEENGYFSNWYLSDFYVDGIKFSSMEQFMMYNKAIIFHDKSMAENIMSTNDVSKIKEYGRDVKGYDDPYWNGIRQVIVYRGLYEKFSQNVELREKLKNTGNSILAECAVRDKIWGIGLSMTDPDRFDRTRWKGKGLLGYTLMMVRDRL